MAQEGKTPYAVFVSFRFAEALAEANALQRELNARGYRTFVSNETPGADLQTAINKAIGESKLQVLLATPTYGKKTNEFFSTFQEMNYALPRNPFLVKMTASPDDDWDEPAADMALSGRMYEYWKPGAPMPDGLVDKIV